MPCIMWQICVQAVGKMTIYFNIYYSSSIIKRETPKNLLLLFCLKIIFSDIPAQNIANANILNVNPCEIKL